jgi:cytochrome c peroxidase
VSALGGALFVAPLVRGKARSCAGCHPAPGAPRAIQPAPLLEGTAPREAPTLLDAARQFAFGWDGLEPRLEAMVARELCDPNRCGIVDDQALAAAVDAAPDLALAWQRAFGGAPHIADAATAIASWLRTQRSFGRWDRYLDGDDDALPATARTGLEVFLVTGCATCHGGRILGGGSVHKLGLARPFPSRDRGRAAATQSPADEFVFKAPPLLHAASTGPWLHDGSIDDLGQAVQLMARHELGRELPPSDIAAIVDFLRVVAADRQLTAGR